MDTKFKKLETIELAQLVPRILLSNEKLNYESYSSAPIWGLMHLWLEQLGLAKTGLAEAFLSPDSTFVAMVYTQRLRDKYGIEDNQQPTGSSYILPLTLSQDHLFSSLQLYGGSIAPIYDVPIDAIPNWSCGPLLRTIYVQREFVYPTQSLVDMPGSLSSKRGTIQRYRKTDGRYALLDIRNIDDKKSKELINAWIESKQDEELTFESEYRFLCSRLGVFHMDEARIPFSGVVVLDKEQDRYAGMAVSTIASSRVWTTLVKISLKDYPRLGDFLWNEMARRWINTHPTNNDGDGSECLGITGLMEYKYSYLKACNGTTRDFGAIARIDQLAEFEEYTIAKNKVDAVLRQKGYL